ncbi:uncharacterized protein LOC125861262 [Solanum stenotomum]|uniref:uncharacterized protein LOC125861262 n=1 Tax=Solanum stenotomum TaxID=172797 RepID=UPI0020D1C0CA|nr:uncharacterized protein LOC125861262 [Solanum stenotomum]
MPLRSAVRGRPARRNVEDQELPNAPEVQLQGEVSNAEFREAIRMLSQVVTNQAGQQRGTRQEEAHASRILAYQMKNVARTWFDQWKWGREDALPASWKQKEHALSSASAPAPTNNGEYYGQHSRAKPAYSQGNVAQRGSKPPACAKCGRNHSGIYREGFTGCFKCGQTGHFMQECPKNKHGSGNGGNRTQYSSVAPPDNFT